MRSICFFVLCLGAVSAKNIPRYELGNAPEHFEMFIRDFNKTYDEAEKQRRYEIFVNNLEKINRLNEQSTHATFGVTQFSDLTAEEFKEKHTGHLGGGPAGACTDSDELNLKPVRAPDAFDWRDKGVVTEVKNQDTCRSCWAFSATGNVESAYAIKYGQKVLLSEQQLIDCDKTSYGCKGGYPTHAFTYLQSNGAMSEDDYPYKDKEGVCQLKPSEIKVKVSSCVVINGTEDDIANKLVQMGPLSITVDSSGALQMYTGGIVKNSFCQGMIIDHAVLLVGYGKDDDGTPYWIVKNSWGAKWGEQGYFRMQRGVDCLLITREPPSSAIVN